MRTAGGLGRVFLNTSQPVSIATFYLRRGDPSGILRSSELACLGRPLARVLENSVL